MGIGAEVSVVEFELLPNVTAGDDGVDDENNVPFVGVPEPAVAVPLAAVLLDVLPLLACGQRTVSKIGVSGGKFG